MRDKKLNNNSLSKLIGLTPATIGQWEFRMPRADVALEIAKILEVSVEYLLTGKDKPSPLTVIQQKIQSLSDNDRKAVEHMIDYFLNRK